MFDFECDNGHRFEDLVEPGTFSLPCTSCDNKAERQISPPHFDYIHMGLDPNSFPTAGAKWADMQTRKNKSDKGDLSSGYGDNLKHY